MKKYHLLLLIFLISLFNYLPAMDDHSGTAAGFGTHERVQFKCNKPDCRNAILDKSVACNTLVRCGVLYCNTVCKNADASGHQFYCKALRDAPPFGNKYRLPSQQEIGVLITRVPGLQRPIY